MTSWRLGLGSEAISSIEQAISRCNAEKAYEATSPTIKQTIEALNNIERTSNHLSRELNKLSPIGRAAIFEKSMVICRTRLEDIEDIRSTEHERVELGRRELMTLTSILSLMAPAAGKASNALSASYSPSPESGQGSNSSSGRDSDLKAIQLDSDVYPTGIRAHSAKDKLAVRVLLALFESNHFMPGARGEIRTLTDLLASVWMEIEATPASFEKIIRQRKSIRAWALRRVETGQLWDKAVPILAVL